MDTLLIYIKNIGFFLILVSVICNALPENTYKKYCKLFCGLVLVVLVIAPFNEILNYDGDIADIFLSKSYQSDLIELEVRLKLQEEQQMQSALEQYEEELKNNLEGVAKEQGLYIEDVNINYTYSDESEDELELQSIDITVNEYGTTANYSGAYGDDRDTNSNKSSDINLDEIHIDDIEINIDRGGDNDSGIDELSPADRPKVIKLIEDVAKLLGVETNLINVTMKK